MYNIFMVKYRGILYILILIFFLSLSFYPTFFELQKADKLKDPSREFILEHNFYWPDYNLYLSKIRQGFEGRWTGLEKYTSEPHKGSFIQGFYVILGQVGGLLDLAPNYAYQLGRIILAPLLTLVVLLFVLYYFKSNFFRVVALFVIFSSGSFPRFYQEAGGVLGVGRYMEWWSNIDAIQRISFIPHIMFGQVFSLFLIYQLTINLNQITTRKFILFIILGNLTGLVFPPSLITLNGVLILFLFFKLIRNRKFEIGNWKLEIGLFILLTLPSLLYILVMTKQLPWSALVDFHRTHPMMIPFWDYILGTGPIFFLGLLGAVVSVVYRDRKFQPVIFWIIVTFGFALVFTYLKEQSPLRFTQTGLFIPLGILGTYLFQKIWEITDKIFKNYELRCANYELKTNSTDSIQTGTSLAGSENIELKYISKTLILSVIILYIAGSLYMMTTSIHWQTNFITQRANAWVPAVPYPPQTMYPLKEWMNGIRWLRDNTRHDEVVIAAITAGNFIPAYSGNTVFFGQSNTVNYDTKQLLVQKFFQGGMDTREVEIFLKNGYVKYIFFSVQEKEEAKGANLTKFYPFLKQVYQNPTVTIYKY
jgi:hypothetical protein